MPKSYDQEKLEAYTRAAKLTIGAVLALMAFTVGGFFFALYAYREFGMVSVELERASVCP